MWTSLFQTLFSGVGIWLVIRIQNRLNKASAGFKSNHNVNINCICLVLVSCCSYSVNICEWLTHIMCAILILSCTKNLSLWNHCETIQYTCQPWPRISIQLPWDILIPYHSSNMIWYDSCHDSYWRIKCHLWPLTFVSLEHTVCTLHLEPHNRAWDSYSLECQIPQLISHKIDQSSPRRSNYLHIHIDFEPTAGTNNW